MCRQQFAREENEHKNHITPRTAADSKLSQRVESCMEKEGNAMYSVDEKRRSYQDMTESPNDYLIASFGY